MHTQILVCRLEECQWSYWSRLQSTPLDNQGESRFWTIFLVFQIEPEISQTIAEVCHFNPTIKFQVFWVVWANLLLTLLQNFIVVRGLLHAFQIFPTVMICRNVATIITFPVLLWLFWLSMIIRVHYYFCINDVAWRHKINKVLKSYSFWHNLSSLPYQFSVFEVLGVTTLLMVWNDDMVAILDQNEDMGAIYVAAPKQFKGNWTQFFANNPFCFICIYKVTVH